MKIEELKIEDCREILEKAKMGRIACAFDNQPYIVPFNFAYGGGKHLYAFSTVGQKILWMRENPLVCVEVEEIKNQEEWATLIISGSYEELMDEPAFENQRIYAHELLSRRPMWWQPAYVAETHREEIEEKPVYFRIYIEKITGHRAVGENFVTAIPLVQETRGQKSGWLGLW
jgi:uncharacterized protein